jgi:hypothetical protein
MKNTNRNLLVLLATACAAASGGDFSSFDDSSDDVKNYVVKTLATAVATADIVVTHSRSDELFRDDGDMEDFVQLVLHVDAMRFSTILKGRQSMPPYSVGYLYPPDRYVPGKIPMPPLTRVPLDKNDARLLPPYFPSLSRGDNLTRLMFLTRQTTPLKDRLLQRDNGARRQMIYNDAKEMTEAEFVAKYELESVFSNQVYSVVEGCAFHVDYPVPSLPTTKLMEMNAGMLSGDSAQNAYLQKNSGLITLSPLEVSEIVYIAYMCDGEGDAGSRYAEACKRNPEILIPMEKADFKTSAGQKLFAAAIENQSNASL